jgi:muramoyltetrapeptide carboxypeptidase
LKKALFGEAIKYEYTNSFPGRSGTAEGILIGGNLTLMVMVQGSASEIDYTDKILFLEDVGEQEYSIDSMMHMLKRAGKLAGLKGLIVGAFNEIATETIPFGASPEQVIWDNVNDYPVCFNFPVGHIDDNRTLVVGNLAKLIIDQQNVVLTQS